MSDAHPPEPAGNAPGVKQKGDAKTARSLGKYAIKVVPAERLKKPDWIRVRAPSSPRFYEIKRILLYAYIYLGVSDWSNVHPRIHVLVPGEPALNIVPAAHDGKLAVCAVASLENVRDGIRLTNHTEYFAGHPEMDRAFGDGIVWDDGSK